MKMQQTTLQLLFSNLEIADVDLSLYVEDGAWTPKSKCLLLDQDERDEMGLPDPDGYAYVMLISSLVDVVENLRLQGAKEMTSELKLQAMEHYFKNDSFLSIL